MRTNSVISDPDPFAPVPVVQPDKDPEPQNDFEKLARSSDYPQIVAYLDQRVKYFQTNLPTGESVENLSNEEKVIAWGQAVVVIRELTLLKAQLANLKR